MTWHLRQFARAILAFDNLILSQKPLIPRKTCNRERLGANP